MIFFEACHVCKPPKRKPGCHSDCPEYAEARRKYDIRKAAERAAKEKENLTYTKRHRK